MEPIRLVVWDLDGTFWKGTLSEGGIEYIDEHHDIVVALAQRGIMSSICSKNDFVAVKQVLEARGIWRYFVFPSIDWEPKGQRIAALIDAVQLRPPTVLFIDDLPANLAEATHYVPDLQVAGPDFLSLMLNDPRLAGREDADLSRLAQYKILETRQADARAHGRDNRAFLMESRIEVAIDYDIEANLDRAIELINRTNQLNFTKNRLPEDMEAARLALRESINHFDCLSGLVKVRDRYGDYGYVGFFSVQGRHAQAWLKYFCFSCRILNMGVEQWVYRWLKCPELAISGETACDLTADRGALDWIAVADGMTSPDLGAPPKILDRLVLRGGCDLDAMSHYLRGLADEFYVELNTAREGRQFRIDNAMFLNLLFEEMPGPVRDALTSIGYVPGDWTSGLSLPVAPGSRTVWVFSFWTDSFVYLYKHKELALVMPFLMEDDPHALCDVTFLTEDDAKNYLKSDANRRAFQALKDNFWGIGPAFEELVQQALVKLLKAAHGRATVIVVLAPETWRELESGRVVPRPMEARFNNWLRAGLSGKPDVHLVEFGDFVPAEAAYAELFHYDRLVYMRAAEHIAGVIKARFGG